MLFRSDHWAARHERDELGIEALALVFLVVTLEGRGIERAQFHRDELQTLLFESGQDRANQLAFDCIGLEEDEGSVAHALQATAQGRAGTTHHVQRSGDENRVVLARDRQCLCARLFDACAFEHLVAAHRACGGCKHGRLEAAW